MEQESKNPGLVCSIDYICGVKNWTRKKIAAWFGIRRGSTRIVLVSRHVVVKIPNFSHSWKNFLSGLIANMNEGLTWKHCEASKKHLLCPVRFCAWGGWFVVMSRANQQAWEVYVRELGVEVEHDDWLVRKVANEELYKPWIDAGLGGDDKADNYGVLNDRVVKIDYA